MRLEPIGPKNQRGAPIIALIAIFVDYDHRAPESSAGGFSVMAGLVPAIHAVRRIERV
jgi:hypothetical protein